MENQKPKTPAERRPIRHMVEIARDDHWSLYHRNPNRPRADGFEGYCLKLFRRSGGRAVKSFLFSHNGSQFAASQGFNRLIKYSATFMDLSAIVTDHARTAWLDGEHWQPPRWSRPEIKNRNL